jgi:colanic acid/amylovoran biosynthesis protein
VKILIDNGCHGLRNMGDVAMLQVTFIRLKDLWPDALIQIVTENPNLLNKYCPDAYPVNAKGRNIWVNSLNIFGLLHRFVSEPVAKQIESLAERIIYRWPSLAQTLIRFKRKLKGLDDTGLSVFWDSLLEADLVAVSGGGDINYYFVSLALSFLNILRMATRYNKTTALFGQGIGPIRNPQSKLFAMAKAILPMIDLICIREKRAGLALLHSLNVKRSKIAVTGDDAIELAYNSRAKELGKGIGINLRASFYSELDNNHIKIIRDVLHGVAIRLDLPLIAVPISFNEKESDIRTIQEIITGYQGVSNLGPVFDTPLTIIQQVGLCSVVVTGSYHGAVFALSQGIPIIGLAKSEYYIDKFMGLAEQFGAGCEIILLDDEQFREKLMAAIDISLRSAEQIRPKLLDAAKQQIESGRAAYQQIYNLVESKKSKYNS